MKKLGLFTNFQYDDTLYRAYRAGIQDYIINQPQAQGDLEIEFINVIPQGAQTHGIYVNSSLFESCFRSALEYAVNVRGCEVLALATRATHLHSIAEEVYAEDEHITRTTNLVSLLDCAIDVSKQHFEQGSKLGFICDYWVESDNYMRERFRQVGFEIRNVFDMEMAKDFSIDATRILNAPPGTPDASGIRFICGLTESVIKTQSIKGILSVGYFELCEVYRQGGLIVPVINLVDEHVKAIGHSILS